MERKTTTVTEPSFTSGEVYEVETLLQTLHERGVAHRDTFKHYAGLAVTTWTAKPWWQPRLLSHYKQVNQLENFAVYDSEPFEVVEPPEDIPRRILVGIDYDGALILQTINGRGFPHFLRIVPAELRRYDDAVFQTVRYILRYMAKQEG